MMQFTRSVTRITRTAGPRATYRDGTPTETESTILGVYQPASRADRRILEERGLSVSETMVLFTEATLLTADEQADRLSDLVEVDGQRFEVAATERHGLGAPGNMLHTKAYLVRYYEEAA